MGIVRAPEDRHDGHHRPRGTHEWVAEEIREIAAQQREHEANRDLRLPQRDAAERHEQARQRPDPRARRNPASRLPVVAAAANAHRGEEDHGPFSDRLITPSTLADRLAEHRQQDRRGRCQHTRQPDQASGARSCRPSARHRRRAPSAISMNSTSSPAERRTARNPVQHDRQLDAADVDAPQRTARSGSPQRAIAREHRHQQTEEAVAAGDGRDQPVIYSRDLHRARRPASAPHNMKPSACVAWSGCRTGTPTQVPADRLQPQAEIRALAEAGCTIARPTSPSTTAHGLSMQPRHSRSQRLSGNGSVPLIEPTPGRFHGPKISHSVNAVATKLSPSPPKISCTPPKVFSAPANAPHSAPPRCPR